MAGKHRVGGGLGPFTFNIDALASWQTYGVAIAVTTATLGVRLAIGRSFEGQPALVVFTMPIMLSGYVGGLGPGLLATALSYLLTSYYLLQPFHSLAIASVPGRWQLFFVVLAGLFITTLNGGLHRARRRAKSEARAHQQAAEAVRASERQLQQAMDDRIRVEEALFQAGTLQRAIFSSATFSIIATDAAGVIQIFNFGAERMLGYTAAEMVNRITPACICDPRELVARATLLSLEFATTIAPEFEALVFRASRGIEDIYELTCIRKDGSQFPGVMSVTSLRDAQDAIIGYLLVGTDNTIRRQTEDARQGAEDARRTSDARYHALFDCAPDGILIADTSSTYLDVNTSMCRMLGYTRDEMIGMHASNIVAESELPQIGPALDVIEATSAHHREWRFRRRDSSEFDADVQVSKMPGGDLLGMVRDITERKRADTLTADAFRELNHVKAALDEHAIVAITNVRGKITYVNDRFCAISQFSREELLGRDHRIINSGCHPKAFIRDLWETIKAGRVWRGEIQNRAKDGTLYWVDTTIVPYLGDGGELVQFIAIRADITEHKRVEKVLQQKNAELEAASRLKSEFLANMSHELRTPLNAIIGFSEVLGDGLLGELTVQQRTFIGDIFSSGNHLLALINDILDLSKVEAGKMMLDLQAVHIPGLLDKSLRIIKEQASARRIHLEIDTAGAPASIEADPRKTTQIVYNLLSNAVKFSADGGRITLRARRITRSDIGWRVNSWPRRDFPLADSPFAEFVEISVTDHGLGISRQGMESLFTPFSQIDGGLARRFEGTGLGLAMVKRLVELHDGTLAVESALGEGSRFVVWLPLRPREEGPAFVTGTPALTLGHLSGEGTRTALVVEDDFSAAELIRFHLEAEGFRVLHTASAEAGLVMALQQPLSLITLDVFLPQMDGWEFLARLKQMADVDRVPVVIISILADRNKGFACGAAAVMQKPISRRELSESLLALGLIPVVPGRMLKVLIVDDDPMALELIAVQIESLGGTAIRAHGGAEAIAAARHDLPDVIVLDLMMPDINGFDVVKALELHSETARIPVIVVTAKRITNEDRIQLQGYVTRIMEKTDFNVDHFVAEIRRALRHRPVMA